MLRGIRKASANWLGRAVMGVVMGLLAASFAVWGINDIFRGFGRSSLAKIGSTEIPTELFRQTYNDRLQQMSRQVGHPVPPEEARQAGLDRRVLRDLIAQAGVDQRVRQMRLGISNEEIARRITEDPTFHGATGKFDRFRFEGLLRNAGFSEQRYVAEQRHSILRRQILDSVSGDVTVPKAWLAAFNQFENQQRSFEYVQFGPAQAGEIAAPTAEELNKYFEARKIMFRAPEYRKVEVLALIPGERAHWMEIPDADVKTAFEQHRDRYVTPERRRVLQMVFPSMQEAQAAEAKIKAGTSFAALTAERGLKESDTDLGTVRKSEIIDPAVADAAFALKEGDVSGPVQGRFGTVIVTVPKIEPEVAKSLTEATLQIRNDLAAERAKAEVRHLQEQIEDERAGGASLAQVAEKLKLPLTTVDVDRSGHEASGNLAKLPHSGKVISAAFASDVGVDNDPIEVDDGYIWYNVAGVAPGRDRTLDEVKDQVTASWRDDEIDKRLQAKSTEMLDKLKAGTPFDALAKTEGLTVENAKLTRSGPVSRLAEALFETPKDSFGSAQDGGPNNYMVFRVTDVTTPPLDANSADIKRFEDTIKTQEKDDLITQYVASLERDLGISVNQAALAQALGNGTPDTN